MNDNGWIKYYSDCFIDFSMSFCAVSVGIFLLSMAYIMITRVP